MALGSGPVNGVHSEDGLAREQAAPEITICNSLEVSILAEGLETEDQRDFLLGAGCFAVQGFLYGRPEPVEVCFPSDRAVAS